MSNEELYQYLLNKGWDSEKAWDYVNSGKGIGGLGLGGGLRAATSLLRGKFGEGKSIGGNLDWSGIKNLGSDIRSTKLFGGPTIAQTANTLSGLYQGGKALKGLYENSLSDADLQSLEQDVKLSMASNPMYDMYMDATDQKTLRQMKNGTNPTSLSNALQGSARGLPKALLSAIMGGVVGGAPGAVINGVGSLVNSGIEGYGQGIAENQSKLQGLYSKLQQAEEDYRSMKRPRGLRSAGLQSQYFNQLY